MKVIRLVLTQNKAHYKKEETVTNKMTYPLPPFSTVIGAIHNACNYKNYHPMDLSIQGSFESVGQEVYTDHCFLNSVMDDRGILVKSMNGDLQSKSFVKVAKALKGKGNSFRQGITIQVFDEKLLEKYRNLKNLNEDIDIFKFRLNYGKIFANKYKKIIYEKRILTDNPEDKIRKKELDNEIKKLKESSSKSLISLFKKRKNTIKEKKKKFDKKSKEFVLLSKREEELKNRDKFITERLENYVFENCTKELSKYQSLTTAPKYYEVLYGVKLIIHISSDEQILKDIKENIYNLRAIGRSEDFVDVEECEIVDLSIEENLEKFDFFTGDLINKATHLAYLNYEHVKDESINILGSSGIAKSGTKYYINKDYTIENQKRKFNKKKVILTSKHTINENAKNVYVDSINNENYILSFV